MTGMIVRAPLILGVSMHLVFIAVVSAKNVKLRVVRALCLDLHCDLILLRFLSSMLTVVFVIALRGVKMGRCIPLELRSSFSSASACVIACPLNKGGYYISRQQLLRAKRSMSVPAWSTVHLLPQDHCKELVVISNCPGNDEVITCAN